MTHQLTEARNHLPYKTRNPHGTVKTHGTPRHILRNTRVPRNPCWRALLYNTCSGAPRVSRGRGQSQFGRPHPACSWQYRCEEWVGSKGETKADLGPS